MTAKLQTVTILFTDLVASTDLLQRAGDEQGQTVLNAHHRSLREVVETHNGQEVKWLGDGLMVAFASTLDAVRCAIAIQQLSSHPTAGQQLQIRVGIHTGEVQVDGADYFGTPVVVARRLCDKASAGQILASDIVLQLIAGRVSDIRAKGLGPLELKGIANAVCAVEVEYQCEPPASLRRRPSSRRPTEYKTLTKQLADAQNGRGSLVLLEGEPSVIRAQIIEEMCEHASSNATVIRGSCLDTEGALPLSPWLEALRSLLERLSDANLREVLGSGAPSIVRKLPEIKHRLKEFEQPPPLDPEGERTRLFDSIGAVLAKSARARPLVIVFDGLHLCDGLSLMLLEEVARRSAVCPIVIVGTYCELDVGRTDPLAQTLAALGVMDHAEFIRLGELETRRGGRRALTRARLAQSAADVFAELGYDAATVDEISRAARMPKRVFYSHFSTKEDAFLELLHSWVVERTVTLKRAAIGGESSNLGPASIIDSLFQHAEGRVWASLVVQFWAYSVGHDRVRSELRRSYRRWAAMLGSVIGRAFAQSDLATAEEAAMAILAARDGLAAEGALAWSRGRSPQPQRAAALALSVLTSMDAAGRRMRSEGIAALNAPTNEAGDSPDSDRGATIAVGPIRDVS